MFCVVMNKVCLPQIIGILKGFGIHGLYATVVFYILYYQETASVHQ